MSKYEDGCYGSAAGIALIGKVLAGRCKMHYTRVAAGKGTIPDGETPKTMSDVAGYVMDAKIAAITNPVDGECQITVQINSADVETGFYCTGLLLYAEDPDEGEVPYTYLVLEGEPEWIRPASSIVGKLATFDIIAAVGDVDAVSAAIDPEAIASIAEVQQLVKEHNEDPEAHADIRALVEKALGVARVVISKKPPDDGPALWFCDGEYDPTPRVMVATLVLGGDKDAATVFANLDGEDQPVANADREETEGGQTAVTIR